MLVLLQSTKFQRKQFASYSDLKIENLGAVRHVEFDRKWTLMI